VSDPSSFVVMRTMRICIASSEMILVAMGAACTLVLAKTAKVTVSIRKYLFLIIVILVAADTTKFDLNCQVLWRAAAG
jgi:hypothetical protein